MRIFRSLTEVPHDFGPVVATIGNFDGVHRGHRWVIHQVNARARELGLKSMAITFDPHPVRVLRPDAPHWLITTLDQKIEQLAGSDVDAVLVLPFDEGLSRMSARECVARLLIETLGVRSVHEGANFRFGYRAEAGVEELREFGRKDGFRVTVHSAVEIRGMTVSSTAVRELVAAGDLRRARWLLGHTFAVRSTPAKGRGIGTRLLVPTVNLAPYGGLLPAFGVYVTRLTVFGAESMAAASEPGPAEPVRRFEAITNVGNRPTFGEDSFAVESHILDFEPVDLTDETMVELEFLYRVRAEKKWPTPEALKAQIMKDVGVAKRYFRLWG